MKVRTLFLFSLYIVLVVCLVPFLLFCMLFGIREPLYAIGKWAMRLSRRILGLELEVKGLEAVDRKMSYVFMANHLSFIDGPLLFTLIPQNVRVILKKVIFRLPVLGLGMKHVGFVPVDRKGTSGGQASISRAVRQIKERGYSFLIFPEGTRSLDGTMGRFRRGGFYLALESGSPILPIVIQGTFETMPKGEFFVKKGRVRVIFQRPIPVQGYDFDHLPDLMDRVRLAIAASAVLLEEK
ncbi:MAG: lysophospholipid acyltransferase family protein [Candidatus Aminicenantales bacterium]